MSGLIATIASTPRGPSSASCTSWPACSRKKRSMSRLSWLSSTRTMRRGEGAEGAAEAAAGALGRDAPAVELGEAAHQGEPDAETALGPLQGSLALEEEVEHPLDHVGRHAGAGVVHREPRGPPVAG